MPLPSPQIRPRPRLRLRTLLIAVALAGLGLGGWQMWKRRERCLERATECDWDPALYEFATAEIDGGSEADRKRELARRYRHVARNPWLPMPRESE